MRIIGWNIRAGGGQRSAAIAEQLEIWAPDVVSLCEFRATPPSRFLAEALAAQGLAFQATAVDRKLPGRNGLLIASRWPLRVARTAGAPKEPCRWLLTQIDGPAQFTLGAMHIPNEVTGRKGAYLDAIERIAHGWRRGPGLLIGDTNSGRPLIDEESPVFGPRYDAWFDHLTAHGWMDAFRYLNGEERVYTWYSPNRGNGFRLDQAFVNRGLLPCLERACYVWGQPAGAGSETRRDSLSDHAALLVDFNLASE